VVSIKEKYPEVDRRTRKGLRRIPEQEGLSLVQNIGWEGISLLIYTRFSLEKFIRSYTSG
jgi:hypothetical protein